MGIKKIDMESSFDDFELVEPELKLPDFSFDMFEPEWEELPDLEFEWEPIEWPEMNFTWED